MNTNKNRLEFLKYALGCILVFLSPVYAATVAYWDFEDGTSGLPFSDMPLGGSVDQVNNHVMRGYNSTYGPSFTDQTPTGEGLGAYCNGGQDGYTDDSFLDNWSPQEWTIEISVRLGDLSGWNTIIGRDQSSLGASEADFYFQNNGIDDRFRVNYLTVGGRRWILDSEFIPVANQWYHLALTSDGSTLNMYCDKLDNNGYQNVGSLDISVQTLTENALAYTGNAWTFGRGWYGGNNVDQIVGYFDNLRLSDTALEPSEFLFHSPITITQSDGKTFLYSNNIDYSDDYSIVLSEQPSKDVTISVIPPVGLDVGNGDGQPLELLFTENTWGQQQTVIVMIANDQVLLPDIIAIKHSSASNDEGFDDIFIPIVNVYISDDSCGLWGFLESDYDLDCYVDLFDFSSLAKLWLMTEDSLDLNPFAQDWLQGTIAYDENIYDKSIKPAESSYYINTANILNTIDEKVYGHFFEHIYHSANGGLWGELVWNRSFEINSTGQALWNIEGDELVQSSLETDINMVFGNSLWTDYELTLEAQKISGDEGFLIIYRAIDANNFYWLNLGGWGNGTHAIQKEVNGSRSTVSNSISGSITSGQWYNIRIRCEGNNVLVYLDDELMFDFDDDSGAFLNGAIGLGTWSTQARYRNISVTNLAGTEILYSGLPEIAGVDFAAEHWQTFGTGDITIEAEALNDDYCVGISTNSGSTGLVQNNYAFIEQLYTGSIWMKGSASAGVTLELLDGNTVLAQANLGSPTSEWAEYSFVLTPAASTDNGSIRISVPGSGNVLIDQVSMMGQDSIDTGGYRPDLLEAVSELRPPIIRWPGGCFASLYLWKDGIGQQHTRRKYSAYMWEDQDVNSYGTDEFLRMCEIIDTKPLLCINTGVKDEACGAYAQWKLSPDTTETYLQDALDWMEYCNGDAETTTWGALRAANGHPEPYYVEFWEIDNETWSVGSAAYIARVQAFAPALQAKAEELGVPIQLIAVGGNGTDMGWNQDIIDTCADLIDYISVHNYDEPGEYKSGPIAYDAFLTSLSNYIAGSSNPDMKIYNSEWNLQSTDWRTGLYAGEILNVYERHGAEFKIGGPALFLRHTSAGGWDNAFINFDHTGWFPAPNYIVMKLWWDHYGPYLVETEASDNFLDVNSVMSEDKQTLYIHVVNAESADRSVEFDIGTAFIVDSAYLDYVAPGDLDARNTLAKTNAVKVQSKIVGHDDNMIRFNMPAYSAGVVTVTFAQPATDKYLYSYFQGNGDGLHLAYSEDGLTFTALNDNATYITPNIGGSLMRDPSICQGPDGVFHLVWTTGWWDDGIGIAHSPDLINWTEQTYLPVMSHESNALNCWAPEIFYDEATNKYLIFWATTIDGAFPETYNPDDDNNHRMYFVSTEDFVTYSETALFYDPGFNVIDAFIAKDGDRYAMVVKDETKAPVAAKNFHLAFSDNAAGPYGPASESISPSGLWVEGPTMMKVEDSWIIYFDAYTSGYMGALVSDDDMETWNNISGQVSFPSGMRHGTVFRVSQQTLDKLLGKDKVQTDSYVGYLMPYFDNSDELLRYAYSYNAKDWTALNGGDQLPWSPSFVRDPYMNRADGKFHFVYTTGWSGTTIGHMVSDDLINWTGGPIEVVDAAQERCWAPEFYFLESEDVFYVYWASVVDGHNTMHYLKTSDWLNIGPDDSDVFYNIGIHDIDLTIVEYDGQYLGFHKAGDVGDQMGNRLSISTSLDPTVDSFADDGYGNIVFTNETKPTEGPEVVQLIGEEKWYVYGDPFNAPLEAWETTDFQTFTKISVSTPSGAKHCSFVPVTQAELDSLIAEYGG